MRTIRMRTHALADSTAGHMWLNFVSDEGSKPTLNETTREFGEQVRNRRVALGLSQEAAAVRCGIHWTTARQSGARPTQP